MQAKWPAHLGTITLDHGKATIELQPDSGATIDGAKQTQAALLDDTNPKPTVVASDSVMFYVVQRGDRCAASRTASRQRAVSSARLLRHRSGCHRGEVGSPIRRARSRSRTSSVIDKVIVPGAAVFEHDGKTFASSR